MENIITSIDNKFYKLLKKLDKKKYRDERNVFKVEGEKFLNENINFSKIIIKESKFDYFNTKYNMSTMNNITILKDNLFDEVSTQDNSQGIIFLYSKDLKTINDIVGDVIIVDDLQDPGNLGTIIRTMEATNYRNLILTKGSVDVYNPKTVRATMGGIFNINIIYEDYNNIISFINNNGYNMIATALHSDSVDYRDVELVKDKNAYVFGNEGGGVSDIMIESSNTKAIIPIYGNIESLNVSIAVAVFLYKMREK